MGTNIALLLLLLLLSPAVLGLMVARCPEGWVSRGGTDQCYLVHSYGRHMDFDVARLYCQASGGDLAYIDTTGLRDWLLQLLAASANVDRYTYVWVGAQHVDGKWIWVETGENIDNTILPWDLPSSGECAALTVESMLVKQKCSQEFRFICHRNIQLPMACDYTTGWEDAMDRCYKLSTHNASWHDAEVQCVIEGGHLATIEGDMEQKLVHDMAWEKRYQVWIGFTEVNHPGVFKWIDGSNSRTTYWDTAQPDLSFNGLGAAVVQFYDYLGNWMVEKITNYNYYVCEKPVGSCVAGWEEFERSCYYFNIEAGDRVVWDDAKQICESVNAKMVVLDTEEEDTFFRTHMPEGDQLWIGLYSKPGDGLYWTDNTPMDNKNFTHMTDEDESIAISKPDKQCVYMQETMVVESVSSWVPTDCTMPKHYACEVEVGQQITLVPPSLDRYCPDGGWIQMEDHCYYFIYEEKTWSAAESDCKARHQTAHLTSISSWGEQDFVFNNLGSNGWIGLNKWDQDKWTWIDGRAYTFTNWDIGEPEGDEENCAEMLLDRGDWNSIKCSFLNTYTCKMPAAKTPIGTVTTTTPAPDTSACGKDWTEDITTGECYRVEFQTFNFYDARLHCQELYYYEGQSQSDLVSIGSPQQQSFVFALLASQHLGQSSVWIGMINDLNFNYWTDGTPSAYFNFNSHEPDNIWNQQCVEMETGSGKWNDAECHNRQPFICEKKGRNYVGPQPPPRPQVACPDGWVSFDNHCYYFSSDKTDWFTAQDKCDRMFGSSLTSVTNEDESNFLTDIMVNVFTVGWIGLRDDDNGENWHWVDGSLFYWTNWENGEPNNDNGNEHCGEMNEDSYGRWNDANCDDDKNYICKLTVTLCPESWVYHDGKCYYVSQSEVTWSEGQLKCQQENRKANLVNIHSEEENTFFMETMSQSNSNCWIGLSYNESRWVWADGTEVVYENWNENEPNNLETEHCGEMVDMNTNQDGKWNNLPCSDTNVYGCEIYPTHLVGCEDDWEAFGDYCYWFSSSLFEVTYRKAQQHCVSLGANVASIHTAEEDDFVYSYIYQTGSYYLFIGLSDIGHKNVFTWQDGTDVTYTNLGSILYYSANDPELCVTLKHSSQIWVPQSCDDDLGFICKKPKQATQLNPESNGCQEGDAYHEASCYTFPEETKSWEAAKTDCEGRGYHLVTLANQFETAFFSALVGLAEQRTWIGLTGDMAADGSVTFTWVTGEPVEYTYWDVNEPDPEHGTCVYASGDQAYPGLWTTESCDRTLHYACEYERTGYTTPTPPTTKHPSFYCKYGWQHIGQRCYKVMLDAATWGDGEKKCVQFGAHLASVGDMGEQGVLLGLEGMQEVVGQYGDVWVGLVMGSESGYEWTDGSAADYVNWAQGQPDSHEGRETCVSADATTLELSDSVCLTHLPFICEAATGAMLTTAIEPTKPPIEKCSDDTSWYRYENHCYKFVSTVDELGQTWWGAHRRCRDEGGELASIASNDENYWIESMIYEKAELAMWIGGRAKLGTGYEWLDGQPFVYENWAPGEPNNFYDQEDCISMYTNNYGYWNDQNCGHIAGRICKRPHGATHPPPQTTVAPDGHCPEGWIHAGTKCVYFIKEWMNFTTARQVCQEMGSKTDLASIHSAAEQAYLTAAMAAQNQHMWIGMRYESGFLWVDQTSVSYTNWGPYEPNGGEGLEECVEVSSETGLWNDISCSNTYGGVCMMTQDPGLPDHHTPNTCPDPYSAYTSYNGACYRALDTPKSWEEAEATCAGDNAHLVSIVSVAENSFVWAAAQQNAFTTLWTGLTNKQHLDTFTWTDGWPTFYTNWARHEPLTNLSTCVTVDVTDGAWHTKDCVDPFPFICKYTNESVPTPDPPVTGYCPDDRWQDLNGGYCYLFSNDTKTWDEANRACLQQMSNLASIHSHDEMKLLKLYMDYYHEPVWIGLVEVASGGEGWSDGTSVNYVNWQDGEPNSGEEQCTEIIPHTGKWNDAPCDASRYYLCKTKKIQEGNTNKPPTETPKPDGGGDSTGGLTGGGIAGIVIAVLFVVGIVGFVGYSYTQNSHKRLKDPLTATYDISDEGQSSTNLGVSYSSA